MALDPKIKTLHRYFIWADRMRVHMQESVKKHGVPQDLNSEGFLNIFLYQSYWYGGLYVVVEGYQELKLTDPVIDPLLQSLHVNLLRRYRNGAFHYQSNYFDERFMEFMSATDAAKWVNELNAAFSKFFLKLIEES